MLCCCLRYISPTVLVYVRQFLSMGLSWFQVAWTYMMGNMLSLTLGPFVTPCTLATGSQHACFLVSRGIHTRNMLSALQTQPRCLILVTHSCFLVSPWTTRATMSNASLVLTVHHELGVACYALIQFMISLAYVKCQQRHNFCAQGHVRTLNGE